MVNSQKFKTENRLPPIILKYENQLERDPNSLVFAALAEAYRKSGNLEVAFQVLRDGIKNHPLYKFAYFTLAHCYFDVGQFQLAYTTLRPFVANERENFRVQNLFAETCIKLGQTQEALESFKYCLFLAPKNHEVAAKINEIEKSISPTIELIEDAGRKKEPPSGYTNHQFEVKNLNPIQPKEIDIDEWIQVDLSHNSGPTKSGDLDEETISQNWQIDIVEDMESPSRNEKTDEPSGDAPIITHTLVDLYCAQGLHQKGIEILQKILELNPNDQKSKTRLQELRQIMASPNNLSRIEHERPVRSDNPTRDTHDGTIATLESFLQALQERARQRETQSEDR